jgi:hypothetical protein
MGNYSDIIHALLVGVGFWVTAARVYELSLKIDDLQHSIDSRVFAANRPREEEVESLPPPAEEEEEEEEEEEDEVEETNSVACGAGSTNCDDCYPDYSKYN